MKQLLTDKQTEWLNYRTIKVGGYYSLPRWGFFAFPEPNWSHREYVDINPFTKSLDGQLVEAKEIKGDFVRVNFVDKPAPKSIWLETEELAHRDAIERFFVYLLCWLPMVIYNKVRG